MNKFVITTALLLITNSFIQSSFATENGSDSFALGAEGMMAGALPPPGIYLLNYYQNYHAGKFIDGPENFQLDVHALIPRLVWMTEKNYLGGQLGVYAAQPIVNLQLNIAGTSDHQTALGDLIAGSMLGWHHGNHHWITALEAVFATGKYNAPTATEPVIANIGKNYNTIRPIFAYSYAPENGLDLSTKISYSFNDKNDDTQYKSGQYFAGDYSIGYRLNSQFKVAIQGYVFKQMTADRLDGVDIGQKGQVFAIGPGIQYQDKNWSLEAKYLTESHVEYRPKGHNAVLKLTWAF
ncbi:MULTISPECIES: transporter [unclassified Acinetobacter]|uniref:SphA family protein n=1 Tax=unclassified Acinetobacter TaxID=196816 RepID=UPI0029344D36|nr:MULTISPECIES: transporter [unclassified Acinetobacter]WOE30764.1 transporter [Acinetobacter sp. SAAs470]WOE38957.1 transporter [Acinetobacter sp. SAAs474]